MCIRRCEALRILLPRTGFTRHRVQAVSSSLGLGPPGPAHILLPCAGPYLRFGFGPIIGLQLRLEPLFLPIPLQSPRICMAGLPIARLCRGRWGPIVPRTRSVVVIASPRSEASACDPWPCPSPRAGPFYFCRHGRLCPASLAARRFSTRALSPFPGLSRRHSFCIDLGNL